MDRGEMPTERGDSWFSPKCIEVQPREDGLVAVERGLGKGPSAGYCVHVNCECHQTHGAGVRRRGLTFVVERDTTRTTG